MEWFDIPYYKGLYQITRCGKVRRCGGGIISDKSSSNKYKKVQLWSNNRRKALYIHRLLAEVFLERQEGQTEVNHKDGDKFNNNLDNLEWCSRSENAFHAYRTMLKPSGELHPKAKLKDVEVRFIRAMHEDGLKISRIYDVYKERVSWATLYNIAKNIDRTCNYGMS
jgi:hypothetical protein